MQSSVFDTVYSTVVRKGDSHLPGIHQAVCVCYAASVVSDSLTLWTVAGQAPLSMGFSRQWVALPFSSGYWCENSEKKKMCAHVYTQPGKKQTTMESQMNCSGKLLHSRYC